MAFPAALTNAVDGAPGIGTPIMAAHLNSLEAKVGVDSSAVVTSFDYLLKNPASLNPGHKHSALWASDGSPQAIWVDAAGNVGVGIATPATLLSLGAGLSNTKLALYDDGTYLYGLGIGAGMLRFHVALPSSDFIFFDAPAGNAVFTIKGVGNVGVGVSTYGTSAAKVFGIATGTAPTTTPADMAQMWVEDINGAAGYAGLHKMTETTAQKEVIPGVIIKGTTGRPANPYEGLMEINTVDNKINMYAEAAWRQLATW